MIQELKKFGLTDNEIKVYLALVELGEATATPIKNKADIHTSRVYEALNSLIEKGMVSYFLKNNVKHFSAQDPDVMFDILDNKREQLLNIMPQIKLLKESKESGYKVSLYEGIKAVMQLYDHILFNLKKTEEILVWGAGKEESHILSRTYFKQYTERRVKKGVKMRMIFNHDAADSAKEYNKMKNTKAKVLPKGFFAPSPMNIYPDQVSILLLKKKPVVFQIDCKEVAEGYRNFFEFLWQNAK